MTDTTKHASQGNLDIEPFGPEDGGSHTPATATTAPASVEQLVVKPTPAPAQAQPARAAEPQPAPATITAEAPSEPPVILKGAKLDPLSTMSEGMGAVVEHNDKAVATADGDRDEDGDDVQYGGLVGLLQKHGKVLGIAAVLGIAGYVFMPHKAPVAPVAAPVATPVATAPVTPAPATTAAPGGEGAVGVTSGVEAHVGAASPDDQARLAAELQADAQAIPPGEQVCSNPHITSFDSMRCGQVGPKLFFQCAPDGRRWDVRKPGCENG